MLAAPTMGAVLRVAVITLLCAFLAAQEKPWLRRVAQIGFPCERVQFADLARDGQLVVALTERRQITVTAVDPWGELRRFAVEGDEQITGMRVDEDGRDVTVVLVPRSGPATTRTLRLDDGAPVDVAVPERSAQTGADLPARLNEMLLSGQCVRTSKDRGTVLFLTNADFGLWRHGRWRWLDDGAVELKDGVLTADGTHLVMPRRTAVEVVPV